MKTLKLSDYDFISSMPDVLLHHILSFLDMHQVVQTCILSERWTNLWRTSPFLSFNVFRSGKDDAIEEEVRRLERFVSIVLLRRKPCDVLRFHLNCSGAFRNLEVRDISTWINYAVRHNAIDLHFHACTTNSVPFYVLNCTSLKKLTLRYRCPRKYVNYQFKGLKIMNLPNLRELVLSGVKIESNFLKQLPVLRLKYCVLDDGEVSSSKLKHLRIKRWYANPIRKISAPNLISFQFDGPFFEDKTFQDTSSLVDMRVLVCGSCDFGSLHKFIARVSSVRNLKLTMKGLLNFFGEQLPQLPVFNNLKGITFGDYFCIYCHFGKLSKFLEQSPNLRKLTLKQYRSYGKNCQCNWEESASYGRQCR